jgi:hypothetical protein
MFIEYIPNKRMTPEGSNMSLMGVCYQTIGALPLNTTCFPQ